MNYLIRGIKNNKVAFLLLTTVVLGLTYSSIDWPVYKITHWSGKQGFNLHWHVWLIMHYVIGFIFLITRLVRNMSEIDKDVLKAYLCFDVYSLVWYLYNGWPEPKEIIVIGFVMACIVFVLIRLWRYFR